MAVNLAAIPKELVESTLFGHEKGAFTGAIRQQLGKFELATGGTLFLDEIGDLRYELQAKLLRAIQEGEIERVGGTHPIKTNFRLIAATNVDLEKAVKEGRFREDLYYRLNVIPIRMPALRDRIEDLPELARFFLRRYNLKFRKNIQGIADSTLQILARYWWPGNIRELENLIERLVAVSDKDWITDEDLPYEFHVAQLDTERTGDREPARAGGVDLRAQLHHPGAREGRAGTSPPRRGRSAFRSARSSSRWTGSRSASSPARSAATDHAVTPSRCPTGQEVGRCRISLHDLHGFHGIWPICG